MNLPELTLKNFKHSKGSHCESTTIRECINYLGFDYSEAMIFGLDATIGMSFWDIEESLKSAKNAIESFPLGGKQGFFTENSLACRLLGLTVEKRTFQHAIDAWKDVEACLTNNRPIVLQVDMGFLPYIKDLGNFHFGGHFVSLIGFNSKDATTLIADNDFEQIQSVPMEAIEKARTSTLGPKFLHPGNVRYTIQKRPDGKRPPFSGAVRMAIQEVVKHMRFPSISQMGLPALRKFAESIETWGTLFKKYPDTGSQVIHNVYGCIEEYGTGGAIFRQLYVKFLEELMNSKEYHSELQQGRTAWTDIEFKILNESIPIGYQIIEQWHLFSQNLKTALNKSKDHAEDFLDYNILQTTATELYRLEDSFFGKLQNIKL